MASFGWLLRCICAPSLFLASLTAFINICLTKTSSQFNDKASDTHCILAAQHETADRNNSWQPDEQLPSSILLVPSGCGVIKVNLLLWTHNYLIWYLQYAVHSYTSSVFVFWFEPLHLYTWGCKNVNFFMVFKKMSCTAGQSVCTSDPGITTHAVAWHFITSVYRLFQSFLDKKQPAVSVNGAYGQCSQIPREGERTGVPSPAAYKAWPCLQLICNAALNIWWCTAFFFLCPL